MKMSHNHHEVECDIFCFLVQYGVIKSVPIGCKTIGAKMLGYPKRCNYLCANGGVVKFIGYPII